MQIIEQDTFLDRAYLLSILDSINDLFYTTDEYGHLKAIYGSLLKKNGFGRENFVGRLLFEIFGEETKEFHKQFHKKCLKGKNLIYDWKFEYGGRIYYYQTALSPLKSSYGNFSGVVGIVKDISRQKHVELIHEEITLKFKTLANAASLAIISLNEVDKIEYCNPATTLIFGYNHEELLGEDFNILLGEENRSLNIHSICAGKKPNDKYTFELEGRKKNGAHFPIEITSASYSILNLKHHVIIVQDIADRKSAEKEIIKNNRKLEEQNKELEQAFEALKNMQMQLIHSEKLASIGQLTSGIAHEINNPLAFVSSNLNRFNEYFNEVLSLTDKWRALGKKLLEAGTVKEPVIELFNFEKQIELDFIRSDFNTLMQHNKNGIERIQKIVLQLRGFSRESNESDIDSDIIAALEDTIPFIWNDTKHKAEIIKEYEDIPLVKCNQNEIKQVFLNLMINASQAITSKGRIILKTYQDKKFVYVEITDTGIGIKPENLKKIFEPFFTTKEPGKGTGLGLWISLTLIQKNRASIDVRSSPGKGSTFTIKFKK